jgi:hypothetical protein
MRIALGVIVLSAAVAVSGCSKKGLREFQTHGTGPDEFLVLPSKPLSAPASYAALPAPTPGGTNLTDQNPAADAVAALGGRPSALTASQAPASDTALLTRATRYGVDPEIRGTLYAEDEAFRKRAAITANIKLFPVDRYAEVYEKQAIDPFDVSAAWRRRGVPTPSSPPEQR